MNDDTVTSIADRIQPLIGKRIEDTWIDELSDKLSNHYTDAFASLEDKLNQQKLLQLKNEALDELFGV